MTGTPDSQVLVVDDYPDTLEMVSIALEVAGYGVLLASSGPHAVSLARRHRPAAVVMDIYMPGMDGIETTRQIRLDPDLAGTPVLAHTARAHRLAGIDAGLFDGICPKPCPPDQLVAMVDSLIQGRTVES